jgi:hypothetical protein
MNERIRELAKQSCEQVFGGEFGEMKLTMIFAEKFAELIIRDCLAMCLTSVGNKDYNTGRMHCHDNIKQHFGVES